MFVRLVLVFGLLIPVASCMNVRRGDTILDVQVETESEEARVRRELWRVDKALEEVKFRYGLTDITTEVIVHQMNGLGQTHPSLDITVKVDGAVVTIHKDLLLDLHPDTDAILLGLFAHEMAHALHYARMRTGDLVDLGLTYNRYIKTESEELLPWVRAYEQLTDMTAIALGYADSLIHQKWASEANIAANHPPHVWNFYLTPDEVRALDADRETLYAKILESLEIVGLPSLHFLGGEPVFDEYEFLTGFE